MRLRVVRSAVVLVAVAAAVPPARRGSRLWMWSLCSALRVGGCQPCWHRHPLLVAGNQCKQTGARGGSTAAIESGSWTSLTTESPPRFDPLQLVRCQDRMQQTPRPRCLVAATAIGVDGAIDHANAIEEVRSCPSTVLTLGRGGPDWGLSCGYSIPLSWRLAKRRS